MYKLVNRIDRAIQAAIRELFTTPERTPLEVLTGDQAKLDSLRKYCPEPLQGELATLQADLTEEINLVVARNGRIKPADGWEIPTREEMGCPVEGSVDYLERRIAIWQSKQDAEKATAEKAAKAARKAAGKHRTATA